MKRAVLFALAALLTLGLSGCAMKELTCDHCGKAVTVSQRSNMEEDWIIFCPECNEELFGDDPVVGDGRAEA
ncbi:MAG: hypothetical protein IJD21_03760 [Oscillospiraceae bacterium]|nr:hypothetical protein [Oscillospiraceae bacterium]